MTPFLTINLTRGGPFVYPLKQVLTNQEPVSKVDDLFGVVKEDRKLGVQGDYVELVKTDTDAADLEVLTDLSVVAEVFHLTFEPYTIIINDPGPVVYPLRSL